MPVLNNLKNYRDEILKAEIGALLFNLGKTHIGFGRWRDHFQHLQNKFKWSSYKEYYKSYFDSEVNSASQDLKNFFDNLNFNIPNVMLNLPLKEIMLGGESSRDFVKKIFFRGCENINSGIDKGSPKEQLKASLWLSNAFGSFKYEVEEKDFDDARLTFFRNLDCFLRRNNYYQSPNWQEIRKFIFDEIKPWYSKLLSDSRYPVNDVSLWDQAYMTASMFKAVLANMILENSRVQTYQNNPNSIKWRILGIQYDKLGLAEKGFKPAHIKWYREISREIDEEIKRLLEYEYPIGNEVYRDETGIYFIVGEDLGKDLSNENLAKLKNDLSEIKDKILEIFKEKSKDEFYPAIFLTKASRGLMNLTYLLERARENFLKADWSKKNLKINNINNQAIGICQVCKQRLVFETDKRDENKNICKTCYEEKTQGRINEWLNNRNGETIWTTELKDKKDRIALVVMKFELMDWLSGDLLNSEVINIEHKEEFKEKIANFLTVFCSNIDINKFFDTSLIDAKVSEIDNQLKSKKDKTEKQKLGSEKRELLGLKKKVERLKNLINNLRSRSWWNNAFNFKFNILGYNNTFEELLGIIINIYNKIRSNFHMPILDKISFFPSELSPDAYNGCKSNDESYNDYIKQVFFGSIIGTEWEKFVKKHNINSKINWQEETIDWTSLDEDDINFLSTIILLFLLRKNPSPARLRRIWESTQEFFYEIEKNLLCVGNIPDKRRKRFYWQNVNILDGEYYDGDALFWAKNGDVYLISYSEDQTKENFKLKKYEDGTDTGVELHVSNANIETYKPYISIIDPTPVSWQFIIPAEYVPHLIKNTQKIYDEHFKYVYGKLPLHIGVVIQDYKKPLYVGINALRKMRRDVINRENLWVEEEAKEFKAIFNEKLKKEKIEEQCNNPQDYYSLYFGNLTNGEYQFYVTPKDNPTWISSIGKIADNAKIKYAPNTFDFEFLDTNTRRNDIYYNSEKNYRRTLELKSNRPYDIEKYLELFLNFREVFSASTSKSKLNNLISLLYDKFENFDANTSIFLASAIINILEPHKNPKITEFVKKWLAVDDLSQLKMKDKINQETIRLFLDMYEFWHKALKEV